MNAFSRISFSLAAAALMALLPSAASAHFKFLDPPSSLVTENGGKGVLPCGEGIASGIVTKVQGGHPLTIRLLEFIPHPGHYRVALSVNSRNELPKDPEPETDARGWSVSAKIDPNPAPPVLMDGALAHTSTPRNTEWKLDVMLPNLNCDKCTLQVIQFMAQHALNVGGGFNYHHCADLQITMDPKLPAADKAWMGLPQNDFPQPPRPGAPPAPAAK
jgi:hypothetical protein